MSTPIAVILVLGAAGVAVYLWVRLPELVTAHYGRVILLLSLLVMPLGLMQVGISKSITRTKEIDFCMSCHEMEVYDVSLQIDDREYMPAVHYQNRLVPQETACYTCHTDYTMYGDVSAKIAGIKHLWAHMFGDIPEPGQIKTFVPYHNDNCLQCHRGSRGFERKRPHTTEGVTLEMLYANQKSCVGSGCHDKIHDIGRLGHKDLWGEPRFPIPEVLLKKKGAGGAEDPFADDGGGGGAKDPFDDDAGGAKDPFADEPAAGEDKPKAPAGDRPASEVENVDDLFDDPPDPPRPAVGGPDAGSEGDTPKEDGGEGDKAPVPDKGDTKGEDGGSGEVER